MFCTNCGKPLPDDSRICGYCGENLEADPNEDIKESVSSNSTTSTVEEDKINTETDNKDEFVNQHTEYSQYIPKKYRVISELKQTVLPAGVKVINKYNKPITTMGFFWTQFILLVPVVNIVLLFIWAFRKNSNANRKAYARSILLWIILLVSLMVTAITVLSILKYPTDINYWLEQLKIFVNNIPSI